MEQGSLDMVALPLVSQSIKFNQSFYFNHN